MSDRLKQEKTRWKSRGQQTGEWVLANRWESEDKEDKERN
jgi:hypothetical protein